MAKQLRFGTLGAARITPNALLNPAAACADVEVVAVAASSRGKAETFAVEHGIARVVDSYEMLVTDPDIDAIYNPLPASLHHPWTMAALRAGKHVLCEKPMSLTAGEAAEMADTARAAGLVCAEAFHYRYHPLFAEVVGVVEGGELGRLRRVEGVFTTFIPDTDPVRHDLALGGGALMDLGCYVVHQLRSLAGEPTGVVSTDVAEGAPGVDVTFSAELAFPDEVTGGVNCSMAAGAPLVASLRVIGDDGTLEVDNPLSPQRSNELRVTTSARERCWSVEAGRSTYAHQLDAFVAAVRGDIPMLTAGQDPVRQMQVVDAMYAAAGLPVRGSSRPV